MGQKSREAKPRISATIRSRKISFTNDGFLCKMLCLASQVNREAFSFPVFSRQIRFKICLPYICEALLQRNRLYFVHVILQL